MELVTLDARIVIASVDIYLRLAEAVNRLDLNQTEMAGIDALREGGSAAHDKAKAPSWVNHERLGHPRSSCMRGVANARVTDVSHARRLSTVSM